jgi:hypothetical protein
MGIKTYNDRRCRENNVPRELLGVERYGEEMGRESN